MGEGVGGNAPTAAAQPTAASAAPAAQPRSSSSEQQHQLQQPELQLLQLRKASDSMGLSIVAARGTGQQQLGIYIKSVVKGEP